MGNLSEGLQAIKVRIRKTELDLFITTNRSRSKKRLQDHGLSIELGSLFLTSLRNVQLLRKSSINVCEIVIGKYKGVRHQATCTVIHISNRK